jgi:hypothetical protein
MIKHSPKIDLESKPRITLDLNPLHEAFCRYIFRTAEDKRFIILNRKQDIGKLIFAHIMSGDFQNKSPVMDHPVKFILPMPSNEHGYWLRYRYIYMPAWAMDKIRDGIDYEFRCWVRERFRIGYDLENMEQKTIIAAILRGLNARNNAANFDGIKKIDYRYKRKNEEIHFKRLLTLEESIS